MGNYQGKRVLLWAPKFSNLYKEIIGGLEKQGASVDYIEDIFCDDYVRVGHFVSLRRFFSYALRTSKRYAQKIVQNKIGNTGYDFLICINGFSFHELIIHQLKRNNPGIKTVLYVWDSVNMYDFRVKAPLFNRCFSFDMRDCHEYGFHYLPLFYTNLGTSALEQKKEYDLFFVGGMHSDRYDFLLSFYKQIDLSKFRTFIKLVVMHKTFMQNYLFFLLCSGIPAAWAQRITLNYKLVHQKIKAPFLKYSPISSSEYYEKMFHSRCILDIALENQTGLSHRVMLALSLNKKIITTNQWIKQTPFYDSKKILCVERNRNNGKIVEDFLFSPDDINCYQGIGKYQIENWLFSLFF